MNRNKFYVTTPIYYVNSRPHIGTLYTTVIADVAARWNKVMGKKVFFLTGTDEHGQKIQEKAQEVGKDPRAFVDTMIPEFKKVWELYGIEYDRFIRTTDADHEAAVVAWIKQLQEQGDIYKSTYDGWYCVPCETFVNVGNESVKDADGNYLCPSCKRQLRPMQEESYFFRLSAYEQQLLEFYEKHPDFIVPKERANEVISFVKSGLKDLSISRKSVSWGIPFPGDPEHTVYVWGDALNNYISAIGYGQSTQEAQEKFAFWWPADMQIMAKDIVRFHAIYWPAFLMAADIQPPRHLVVHGYILMGEQKMSKSLGNAIDPQELAALYGPEAVRYFLMRNFPISHDGQFDLKSLEDHVAADLANNLGNLLSRTVTLALNNGLQEVKPPTELETATVALREKCAEMYRMYWEEMNKGFFHIALAEAWKYLSAVNAYFQEFKPWVLCKNDPEMFQEVIYASCHSLYAVAVLLWPVMPTKMEQLLASLGHTFKKNINYDPELRANAFNKTYTLTKLSEPLFVRPVARGEGELSAGMVRDVGIAASLPRSANGNSGLPDERAQSASVSKGDAQDTPTITIDDFAKVHMLVGTVTTCEPVPGSEKLYKLAVDLGSHGMRQILSGVAQYFKPEELIGKQGVFVGNLAPRKMMKLESHGMMLFAKDEKGNMRMVTVCGPVENGTRVS